MKWVVTLFVLSFLGLAFWATPFDDQYMLNKQFSQLKPIAKAYSEILISNQLYGHHSNQAKESRLQTLYRHGLDQEKFSTGLKQLRSQTDLWLRFQQEVVDHLDSLKQANSEKTRGKPNTKAPQRR